MYGNDKTTKRDGFLRRIANGGLDYIKNTLDSYHENLETSPFDDGIDDIVVNTDKKGYTSEDILKFCN